MYNDGEENEVEDDDPDCERGNGPNEGDTTFMDSTYTGIGSMDINSTVQSVGQISKPQQFSTPARQNLVCCSPLILGLFAGTKLNYFWF